MEHSRNAATSLTLLHRLQDAQDQQAWEDFVDRYAPEILRWCMERGLQDSDARDVTQDILHKLVTVMREFEYHPDLGSFRGWLKTVTRNSVQDLGKKWSRRIAGSGKTEVNQFLHSLVDTNSTNELEKTLESRHEQELLAEARKRVINRVQPRTWKAFELTTDQEHSAAQVAQMLEMPVSEVYVSRSRVIRHLRNEIRTLAGE